MEKVPELQRRLRERAAPESSVLYQRDLAAQQVKATNGPRPSSETKASILVFTVGRLLPYLADTWSTRWTLR